MGIILKIKYKGRGAMKRFMLLVTLLTLVVLGGCGKKEVVQEEKKVLYVGTNAEYKPFEYLEEGKIVGFDAELMEKILENLGYEMEWKNMSFDGLIPALQSEKLDLIIAGMTPTDARKKAVDFSDSYLTTNQSFVILEGNEELKTLDDLKNKKLGVQLGTAQETIARDVEGSKITAYTSITAAILDLQSEKVDAVVLENLVALPYIKNNKGLKKIDIDELPKADVAIAINKGNEELLENINKEINNLKENGFYDEIFNKYFVDLE
jgi:polar amino acid transport system substrate-binding protein